MPELIWALGGGRLILRQGDITQTEADAVVNAANSRLAGGGGVDGAIHRAAGPELPPACRAWVAEHGELPAGQAMVTSGFRMRAAHIIHTVGPVWRGGGHGEEAKLRSAYEQSLARASELGCASAAFPTVSCGVYGYPIEKAAPVALAALRGGLERGLVRTALLYLFSQESYATWTAVARRELGDPEAA